MLYQCGADAANKLDNFIGHRIVSGAPINLDVRSRPVLSTEVISGNGSCATALRWTGLDIPKQDTGPSSGEQSKVAEDLEGELPQLFVCWW